MIKVTLKGGEIREFEKDIEIAEAAKAISMGFYKSCCCAKVDGKIADLRDKLTSDCELVLCTFNDEEGKKTYWHTASHVLAQAVKRLYPDVLLGVGPATSNGFFYDFATEESFTPEDLNKIEAEMKKIIKENLPVIREFPGENAQAFMKERNEPFKLELIGDHMAKNDVISFYTQGEFTDLCAGPHLMSTGMLKAIKLTQCTGAYWKGDANNPQMNRVYGTAFPKQAELDAYLEAVEEAKKRDHNLIGRQLGYFTTNDLVGQGLPLLMPKGARVIQLLQRFVEDEEQKRGYVLTKTPFMAKKDLYVQSGHWSHYRDGMFILGDEENEDEEVFALRPMTCPFQFCIYNNDLHSYKDLPIRYGETSTLFRNESSGEMHGLIRVRQFTISEGHLVVTPEQLKEEFGGVVDLINYFMQTFGIDEDISYRFSKRDKNNKEKYIDDDTAWDKTEDLMREILEDLKIDFTEEEGEAAFYGPKLDIQMKNVHGKEDTIITVQIDFCLAERFNMTYVAADGSKLNPYIIHRTSIGCYERTLAMLIEKYAGAMPLWLSPEQMRILPISEKQHDKASALTQKLRDAGFRVFNDVRNEKIGYKIREAQLEKIPYMLIIGEKEAENGTVSLRSRKNGDMGEVSVEKLIADALLESAMKTR